jgi:hypothetical protein
MGDLEKINKLLNNGADVNYRAYDDWTTPIIAASRIKRGRYPFILKFLLV